ncbi:cobalamin B12-binding domain-containing protein [Sporichthya brevicatena]|uniref:Cobalamin B12-binding domain-containing protein n=1 Tax=Sporichthya brevicatena TaxID=171442 RepID=A0ABN1GCZ3_9ACTN
MRVRVLLGMLGVDVHSRGLRTVSRILRDAGVEVIYLGEHNSAAGMAAAAVAEDVDAIGVSFSVSTYTHYVADLTAELRRVGAQDIPVMVGGLIHPEDVEHLRSLGVAVVFGPDSTPDAILDYVGGLARAL